MHHRHTQSHMEPQKAMVLKKPICHPLERWSQTNMVATPWVPRKTYIANLLELYIVFNLNMHA